MTACYQRPPFQGARFKQPRGSAVLAKEKTDKHDTEAEIEIKKLVKLRDQKCRWPERHKCRKGLECAHLKDASLGGLVETKNLMLVCGWIHRRGPESIHGKQLEIRPLTKAGADGPCSFYRKRYSETRPAEYTWRLVHRETAIGVYA